jgi:hypothetical protein
VVTRRVGVPAREQEAQVIVHMGEIIPVVVARFTADQTALSTTLRSAAHLKVRASWCILSLRYQGLYR